MTDAPPVAYPTGRSRWLALVLLGLVLLGAAAVFPLLLGAYPSTLSVGAVVCLLASWLAAAAGALGFWRSQHQRELRWDGARWALLPETETDGRAESALARVEVILDGQSVLLLRYVDAVSDRRCWLWAQASHDRRRWHLLRCALYSSAASTGRPESDGVAGRA